MWSDFRSGIICALKGQTSFAERTVARLELNMMARMTPLGQVQFMIVEGTIQADQVWKFLKRLMRGHQDKIVLIWDGHARLCCVI